MTADVLVVGSANADLVVPVYRRPAAGETVLGGDTEISAGGKGANTAVAAARLGADVAFLGVVGDDPYGTILLDSLRESGVRTDFVRTVERPTGIAYITVTPDGENAILVSPGANAALRPADIDGALDGVRVMVTSLEIPLPTAWHAVEAASVAGARVVLNFSPAAKIPSAAFTAVDVLLVNEHEAAWLLGSDNYDAGKLLQLGPRAVVLTLGASGAVVATPQGLTEIPAPVVEVVDTTGAGDAFAGALAASLAEGGGLVDAAHKAVEVAAFSVTRRGAQPSYPQAGEL